MQIVRKRTQYIILVVIVIIMGLSSRRFSSMLPGWLGLYAGDTLWGLMVFFTAGFIFKGLSTFRVATIALSFSIFIEISQLYHSPWIDAIRHTRIGGLILGYGFLWSDILCYTVGVAIGLALELSLIKKSKTLIQSK